MVPVPLIRALVTTPLRPVHPVRNVGRCTPINNPRWNTHTTPSERTGPPRSILFNSLPNSRVVSRTDACRGGVYPPTDMTSAVAGPSTQPNQYCNSRAPELKHNRPRFRDAFEHDDPDQREREWRYLERVERKPRDSGFEEQNTIKLHRHSPSETPMEGDPPLELGVVSESEKGRTGRRQKVTYPFSPTL